MPKFESERILVAYGKAPEKAAIVVPSWALAKTPKKGRLKGAKNTKKGRMKDGAKKLIAPQADQTVKRGNVLEVDKYDPDEIPKWKRVNAHPLGVIVWIIFVHFQHIPSFQCLICLRCNQLFGTIL